MGDAFPVPFGRYTLIERLALGGMAELFVATAPGEHGFERKVVIKRLLPHLAREPVYTAMFIDEAKLTARLAHPKIAQTYELGRVDDALFIAMEFVDGIDVLGLLREHAWQRKRPQVEHAVWIAHEVLDALDFAHHLADEDGASLGVVHRDISPSNLLLSRRGDVKLVDFGIARAGGSGRHHRTKSGTLKGKYGYMSPEQVLEQPVDARSDLFSVGVVLAEMLCGRRLFAAAAELDVLLMVRDAKLTRLDQFGGHIPPSLDHILRRALAKDVDARWQSAAELRDALADWMFQERVRVTPRHIGELVESLHDTVWKRKRETMAHADAENAALAEAGPGTVAATRRRRASEIIPTMDPRSMSVDGGLAASADGIPRGELRMTDSLPIISIEEIDESEPSGVGPPSQGPLALGSEGAIEVDLGLDAPTTGVEPSGLAHFDDDDDLGLGPAGAQGSGALTLPADDAPAPPPPNPVAAAGFLDTDFGDLAAEIEAAVLHLQSPVPIAAAEVEASVRYASIEDAISAVSPLATDPSALDFDETAVEPDAGRVDELALPSPAEIVDAAGHAEPPPLGEVITPSSEEGEFAATPPLTVLFRLAATKATGLLVASVGGIKKEIYVRGGIPEYVTSNVASELLGAYLVQCGALSSGELAMALAMMPHYGGKLGDTLVGLGLLKPLEVFRHLTVQVRQKLIDVCTWTKGSYGWYEGREIERNAFPLDLNPFEVLGAGAMAMRDDLVLNWLGAHAADTPLHRLPRPVVPPERFEIVGLPALFARIDGLHTVGELVTESLDPATQRRTARMLLLLQQAELTTVDEI
ncbi:MAG: serine/threonine-protein kinase [Kofleriaceae bacterium]